jgi:hypothetical protein
MQQSFALLFDRPHSNSGGASIAAPRTDERCLPVREQDLFRGRLDLRAPIPDVQLQRIGRADGLDDCYRPGHGSLVCVADRFEVSRQASENGIEKSATRPDGGRRRELFPVQRPEILRIGDGDRRGASEEASSKGGCADGQLNILP